MKTFLIRLLAVFGLAPSQAQLIDELRTSLAVWKTKASEAAERARAAEGEAREHARRAQEFKAVAERLEKRSAEVEKMREQLAAAEHELAVAREHLMGVEVKLDILEGAANVLDLRTRSLVREQPSETGAPV